MNFNTSSDKIVIRVRDLGKKYYLGEHREQYLTFRDLITGFMKVPFHKIIHRNKNRSSSEFWALSEVTFDVKKGDVIGIIGRNGAGKSTLLKILSRVTTPTTGEIEIHGRIGSLLEIGTGFHPELTGRENIFLSGSILGMKRKEIEEKFDEIVKFAEIEKFLDIPVKRYSSGMYVRLAFAVAAHLDTEILIVDEVLAVGDAQFQKKCLGKMDQVSKSEGRTVLFVSHNMGSIVQLCNKALLFENGHIIQSGLVKSVVNSYMNMVTKDISEYSSNTTQSANKEIAILKVQTLDETGNQSSNFLHNEKLQILITCKINHWVQGAEVGISVRNSKVKVFTTETIFPAHCPNNSDEITFRVAIPSGLLRPDRYFITIAVYLPNQSIFDLLEDVLSVTIVDGGSRYAANEGLDYGCVFVECPWMIISN